MRKIMFARLAPNGNFIYNDKQYVNGNVAEFPDDVAEALISCNLAVDIEQDPEFAGKFKAQIEKDNIRRSKVIDKIQKRR